MAQSRKAPATKKKSGLQPFYYVLGGLLLLGIIAIGVNVLRSGGGGAALEPVPLEGLNNQQVIERAQGVKLGPDNAPAKLLVFSDFMCPYCGQFAAQIEPQLKSEFIDKNQLQMVFYDFPLGGNHVHSFLAARAARCAGDQNKFWEYHNSLFGSLQNWGTAQNPPINEFEGIAETIGIDKGQFSGCLKSDKYQDVVSASRLLGDQLGVNATPTLILNGKRVRGEIGLDWNSLRDLINAELGVTGT
ncbi:MAG TPA: thioredoxin domain-containing protein [Longimicrobiales bacterium]